MLLLEPVHAALRAVLDPALIAALASCPPTGRGEATPSLAEAGQRLRAFLLETREFSARSAEVTVGGFRGDIESAAQAFEDRLLAARKIAALEAASNRLASRRGALFAADSQPALGAILAWAALEALGHMGDPSNATDSTTRLFDALRLRDVLAGRPVGSASPARIAGESPPACASPSLTRGRLPGRRRGPSGRPRSTGSLIPIPHG